MTKILQTFNDEVFVKLQKEADRRGISVQELIRAVIVPTWIKEEKI